jgi:5,10-methenyltetrahydromethanopterin hydrogenase
MSENVGSSGIMVPLTKKMSDEEREEIIEAIWDSGNSLVQINYEGTIAYTNHRSDGYGIEFGFAENTNDLGYIRTIMEHYGFSIVEEQARPYSCYWYNGADSDMDMLELEEFLIRTKQV